MADTVTMTPDQEKLVSLIKEYETEAAPARGERNAAYQNFDKEWSAKWSAAESEITNARGEIQTRLEAESVDPSLRAAIEAKEIAAIVERHEVEKHSAQLKLEEVLPKPRRWVNFLQEQQKEHPGDLDLQEMIDEARSAGEAGIEGEELQPPRRIVLDDLQHVVKDGQVHYKRGLLTAIKDVGDRLDVMRLDDRDIEAAMKIASQKFDREKPLVLTGDPAFKARAAVVAARMGLKIANREPAVQKAYMEELARIERGTKRQEAPYQAMSIRGNDKQLDAPALLRVEKKWLEAGEKQGLVNQGVSGDEVLIMERDRFNRALQESRVNRNEITSILESADPAAGLNFGLDANQLAALRQADPAMVDENGNLSQDAHDVLIVMSHERVENGAAREADVQREQARDQEQQVAEEKGMDSRRLVSRNVDQQAQEEREEKKERARKIEFHEPEPEPALER